MGQGRAWQKEAMQGLLCLSLPPPLAIPVPLRGSFLHPGGRPEPRSKLCGFPAVAALVFF